MTEAALAPANPAYAVCQFGCCWASMGIAFDEVLDHHGLNAARKVQAVLLDDTVGTLMVLFPQSQLLDLNRLTELTGRRLTAVSTERRVKMLGKHNLSLLPGLPALTSSPCLYEESLLGESTLLIDSGEPGVLAGNHPRRLQNPADQGQRRKLRRNPDQHPPEPRPARR